MTIDRNLIAGAFLAFFIVFNVIKRVIAYRRLSHFPGPRAAGWTNLWLAKQIYNNRKPYAEVEGLKTHGSPLRIAPNILTTDDPDLFRHMHGARGGWSRGDWYDGVKFGANYNSVFSERNEKIHAEKRAQEIGAYQMKDVLTIEDDIDECLVKTIHLLETRYQDKPCDVAEFTAYFTLDILSKIAFGEAFGFIEADADLWNYNGSNRNVFAPLEMMLSVPWLRDFIFNTRMLEVVAPKATDKEGAGRVIRFARDRIQARYARDPKGIESQDFLGHFIRKGLTQNEAEAESRLQVIAGSDSTSSAIRNTLNLILTNTRVLTRLRTEIDQAVAAGEISYPIIKNTEAQRLPYLQACIWEGLRIYPPLFGLMSKTPPPEGDTFKDKFFPPGVEVCPCFQGICRRADIFGERVDVFRPERFLDADPVTLQKRNQTVELIFGSGKYSCLGKNIGMMEQNKFLVEMLRRFDWQVTDACKGSRLIAAGLWVQQDMNYNIQKRQDL